MGTSALVKVKGNDVCLYVHHDGYPEDEHGMLARLEPFCEAWEASRRGYDPEYMMAQLVMHFGRLHPDSSERMTGFGLVSDRTKVCVDWFYEIDSQGRLTFHKDE